MRSVVFYLLHHNPCCGTFVFPCLPFPPPATLFPFPFACCAGSLSFVNICHSSSIPTRCTGSMLYCKLYRFLRWIGGTNCPESRHRNTLGEK